eukprot:scaffold74607_cov63-Phaeocystis_antarctica.AAC.2
MSSAVMASLSPTPQKTVTELGPNLALGNGGRKLTDVMIDDTACGVVVLWLIGPGRGHGHGEIGALPRPEPRHGLASPLVHLQSMPVLIHGVRVLALCTRSTEADPLAGTCPPTVWGTAACGQRQSARLGG